jgi:hypothetical protein
MLVKIMVVDTRFAKFELSLGNLSFTIDKTNCQVVFPEVTGLFYLFIFFEKIRAKYTTLNSHSSSLF